MNGATIYTKTSKGVRELTSKSKHLSRDTAALLALVDGRSSVAQLYDRSNLSRAELDTAIATLSSQGYIKVLTGQAETELEGAPASIIVSEVDTEAFLEAQAQALARSRAEQAAPRGDELKRRLEEEQAKAREAAEAKARAEAEAKARAEARAKAEAEAKARAQAEAKARAEVKAREGAEAKARAEAQAREEAETKARAEAQARQEAEAKARAEAQARQEAEAKARAEAQAKAEAEARATAEAKARQAAEDKARAEAKARQEAEAKARAEAQIKAEAEARARAEAEARAKAEAEAVARARAEAEGQARAAAEAMVREAAEARRAAEAKAEAETRAREELEARVRAEALAREEAESRARVEAQARQEAEARAREEAGAREEAEARVKIEVRSREEAEARAREEARVREKAEARAREEGKAKERAQAEARKEGQAKVEAEEQARAEARAKAEAEEQARRQAEAEQRALEEEAAAEARAQAAAEAWAALGGKAKALLKQPVPLRWLKPLLAALAVLLVAAVAVVQLAPLNVYLPQVEKLASRAVGEPVSATSLRASLFPAPHLTLRGVAVGRLQDVKVGVVRITPVWRTLFGDTKVLKSLQLESVALGREALPRIAAWMKPANGAAPAMRVRRVDLKGVVFSPEPGLQLPMFGGSIMLAADGAVGKAHLESADGKLQVELSSAGPDFQLTATARNWRWPTAPEIQFDELAAKGAVNQQGIALTEIAGRMYRGTVKGSARLDWAEGWSLEGAFTAAGLELEELLPVFTRNIAINGKLDAHASYAMEAATLDRLLAASRVTASFSVRGGVFGGVDLMRVLQSPVGGTLSGGQTRFTDLAGTMSVVGGRYQFRQLRLFSGPLNATASADIEPDGRVVGGGDIGLRARTARAAARFAVSGGLGSLELRRLN